MIDLQFSNGVSARRSRALEQHVRWAKMSPRLVVAANRAAQRCLAMQGDDGRFVSSPDPRPFETALVGIALSLSRDPRAHGAIALAKRWLSAHASAARDPMTQLFDESLARIWSGERLTLTDPFWQSALMLRKTWSLQVFASLLEVDIDTGVDERFLRALVETRFDKRASSTLKPWHRVELAAMCAILSARGGNHALSEQALDELETLQERDGSFCFLPVSTALALVALARRPQSPRFEQCLRYLLDQQQPDGAWLFTTNELWDTSILLRTFDAYAELPAHSVERAREFLVRSQQSDGGWGFRVGVQSDNDTSASALMALGAGPNHSEARARCVRYLRGQRLPSGLWRTWQDANDAVSDDVLAHVVVALRECPEAADAPFEPSLSVAEDFLGSRFGDPRAVEDSWYRNRAYSMLEVAKALPPDHPALARAMSALVSEQNNDGGWGALPGERSIASATGLAITALLRFAPERTDAVADALGFMIDSQRADGSWTGVPEMLGPRPLVSHYPSQTHAFAASGVVLAARLTR